MGNARDALRGARNRLRRALLLGPHTCPWWLGYSFDNPLRRFVHDPRSILGSLVEPDETALDIGCGLGYFSLALAELVGVKGRVVAVDIQPQMVFRARRRAERRGLAERIEFRVCGPDRLGVPGPIDFALAFWVLHEVADPEWLLGEVRSALRPGGRLLIIEPRGHVSGARFAAMAEQARAQGFGVSEKSGVRLSRAVICTAGASDGGGARLATT